MTIVTGEQACVISFTGVGIAYGAIAGGSLVGVGSVPGMLAAGAVGFVCGKLVCRFRCFKDWFDDKLSNEAFDQLLSQKSTREEVVAAISVELGIERQSADQFLTLLVAAMKMHKKSILQSREFTEARHQPATGRAQHGISLVKRAVA